MKNKGKFDRLVNIRTRDSDRRIFWYAIGVTVAAHLLFFGVFSYRAPARRSDDRGSAVEMLSLDRLSDADRVWFDKWLEYHDPRNSDFGVFGDEVAGGALWDLRPSWLTGRPPAVVATPPPALGVFDEVPDRASAKRVILPAPPAAVADDVPVAPELPPPVVTDGEGRALPLGDLKLPPRSPRTTGRTVLRVFKAGGSPALLLERSCGDAALDGVAVRSLALLARREPAPEFIVVEWPEAKK